MNRGEEGRKEGAARWGKEKGEFSQTGDAHFTMTGWWRVGRGSEAGKEEGVI